MEETTQMSTCPMAKACRGMMARPGSGLWTMIPGILFIALGLLIVLYPQILAWLIAIALVVMGMAMLMMSKFMRSIGKRIH